MSAFGDLCVQAHRWGAIELQFNCSLPPFLAGIGDGVGMEGSWVCRASSLHTQVHATGRTGEEALRRCVLLLENQPKVDPDLPSSPGNIEG